MSPEADGLPELPAPPRPSLLHTLRMISSGGGGRADMLSPLQRLHDEYGPVVMNKVGVFNMVNLFGPDANRFVLLDRDRIFSRASRGWRSWVASSPTGCCCATATSTSSIARSCTRRSRARRCADYRAHEPDDRARSRDWGERRRGFLAFRAFKELTLDIAASIFVGVELGPGTTRMNGVFEDLVAASMSRLRLPIPGLEFHRGLKGREFMCRLLPRPHPAAARRRRRRHVQPPLPRRERGRRALHRLRRHRPHGLPDDGGARHDDQHATVDDLRAGAPSRVAGTAARGEPRPRRAQLDFDDIESSRPHW